MDKGLLVLLIIVGGAILFGLILMIQDAEAEHGTFTYNTFKNLVVETLEHILVEEEKQTKLLDQQNCLITHTSQTHTYGKNKYSFDALEEACGKILGISKRLP